MVFPGENGMVLATHSAWYCDTQREVEALYQYPAPHQMMAGIAPIQQPHAATLATSTDAGCSFDIA
jgi:hypothetical protein